MTHHDPATFVTILMLAFGLGCLGVAWLVTWLYGEWD